jgi:hypothetical protein
MFLLFPIPIHPFWESGWVQGWSQSDAISGMGWQKKTPPSRGMDTNHMTESQREWLWSMEIQMIPLATSGNMAIANLQGWPLNSLGATWTGPHWFPLGRASVPSRWQVSWWRLIARVSWARMASWKLQRIWEKSKNIWPVIMTSVTQNKNDTH